MNKKIANALFGYFETLYYLNQKLIKLCGIDVIDDFECAEKNVLDIIQDIPRIIPYSVNKCTKKLKLDDKDGLLEYKDNIDYLKQDYEKILLDNYDFLKKVKKIRNKYEHKMHGINHKSSGSGTQSLFDFTFEVEKEEIKIYAGEFIKLLKELNVLYSKLVADVNKYAHKNEKESYLYYRRITKFEFNEFNKLYESGLLRTFGKILKKY